MQDYSYVVDHASKPDIDNKSIWLNDLEEGLKLALHADIEHNQRLMEFKEAFERDHKTARDNRIALENKRKSDHIIPKHTHR